MLRAKIETMTEAGIHLYCCASKKNKERWDLAVSGAHAGKKEGDELVELRKDKERLDWAETQLIHLYDGGGSYLLEYGPISAPKRVGDDEEMGIRQAIDKAMSDTTKGSE